MYGSKYGFTSNQGIKHYKIKRSGVAQACINIKKRHPWCHDQRTFIISLADEELLPEVREISVSQKSQSNTKIRILLIWHN